MAKTTAVTAPAEAPEAVLPPAAEARAELQRGARIFRAFEHADQALALLENIEQVTRERRSAADSAQADVVRTQEALGVAAEELATVKAEAKKVLADSKAKAAKIVNDAEDRAAEIIMLAEQRVAALQAEGDALVAELIAKQVKIDEIEPKLAAAQATIEKAARLAVALSEG